MDILIRSIFIFNVGIGIYVLYLTMKFQRDWIIRMRMMAVIYALMISGMYPLLDYAWKHEERSGNVLVPLALSTSFSYWELSVAIAIFFVLVLMLLSINSGYYAKSEIGTKIKIT